MVHRDPETGQFVSDGTATDELPWHENKVLSGAVSYTINAADLSGGSGQEQFDGPNTKFLDFGNFLAKDEVYDLHAARVVAHAAAPTTATAESSGGFSYQIGDTPSKEANVWQTSPFYVGTSEDGPSSIVDRGWGDAEADRVWHIGSMPVMNSLNDTTNGTGAGGDNGHETEFIDFVGTFGDGPSYDASDELYAPGEFWYDNISDHGLTGQVYALLFGEVQQVDR